MRRLLLWLVACVLVVALPGQVMAQTTYHAPVSTGDNSKHCGTDTFDGSGVIYYEPADRWFHLTQSFIQVFNGCSLETTTNTFACSATSNDHEGITTISTTSDVIIIQTENGGGICTVDADDIIDGGAVTTVQDFDWPAADGDCGSGMPSAGGSEGVAFVPDATLTGTCRHDGFLMAADQGSGYWYKYCIHPTNATLDCLARYAKPTCNGSTETGALWYDYENVLLYNTADAGNATCIVDPFDFASGYTQTILDPTTTGRTNTFEGHAVGNGFVAFADDGTGGTNDAYNGFWLFEDSYCGDGVKSAAEACDNLDLDSKTCATQVASSSGTLACNSTCTAFDTTQCLTEWHYPDAAAVETLSSAAAQFSGSTWDPVNDKWYVVGNDGWVFVFNADGSHDTTKRCSNDSSPCSDNADCIPGTCEDTSHAVGGDVEGVLRGYTGEWIYFLLEDSGLGNERIRQYNLATWDDDYTVAPVLNRNYNIDVSGTTQGSEGITFIPLDASICSATADGGCEDGGAFVIGSQITTTGQLEVYLLDPTDEDSVKISGPAQGGESLVGEPALTEAPCVINHEFNGLGFEESTGVLYYQTGAGGGTSAICVAIPPVCSDDASRYCFLDSHCPGTGATCVAASQLGYYTSWMPDLSTHWVEGVGVCDDCGVMLGTTDRRSGSQHGKIYTRASAIPAGADEIRHVATTGDDQSGANDCQDAGSPCLTIQQCIDNMVAGDTCQIANGDYDGLSAGADSYLDFTGLDCTAAPCLVTAVDVDAASPNVTMTAATPPEWSFEFDTSINITVRGLGGVAERAAQIIDGSDNITIDQCTLTFEEDGGGVSDPALIEVDGGVNGDSDFFSLTNSFLLESLSNPQCTGDTYNPKGVTLAGGTGHLIENNTIRAGQLMDLDDGVAEVIIKRNIFEHVREHGITMNDGETGSWPTNIIIENNIFRGDPACESTCTSEAACTLSGPRLIDIYDVDGLLVRNNTVVGREYNANNFVQTYKLEAQCCPGGDSVCGGGSTPCHREDIHIYNNAIVDMSVWSDTYWFWIDDTTNSYALHTGPFRSDGNYYQDNTSDLPGNWGSFRPTTNCGDPLDFGQPSTDFENHWKGCDGWGETGNVDPLSIYDSTGLVASLFTNYAAEDYSITGLSPLADAGVSGTENGLGATVEKCADEDFYGNTRTGTCDIGAFQVSSAPVVCNFTGPTTTATVHIHDLAGDPGPVDEASGLVISDYDSNLIYLHNDGGPSAPEPWVYLVSRTTGAVMGAIIVDPPESTFPDGNVFDVEDIAYGPGPTPDEMYVYLSVTGGNQTTEQCGPAAECRTQYIWRFKEQDALDAFGVTIDPLTMVDGALGVVTMTWNLTQRLQVKMPTGLNGGAAYEQDAEALFVDPLSDGDLYLATKRLNVDEQTSKLLMLASEDQDWGRSEYSDTVATWTEAATLTLEGTNTLGDSNIVGADITRDGRLIGFVTSNVSDDYAYFWVREAGQTIAEAITAGNLCRGTVDADPKNEAIGFADNTGNFVTISENLSQPINEYTVQTQCDGGALEYSRFEACDGANLDAATCADFDGFWGAGLACTTGADGCESFDTSGCDSALPKFPFFDYYDTMAIYNFVDNMDSYQGASFDDTPGGAPTYVDGPISGYGRAVTCDGSVYGLELVNNDDLNLGYPSELVANNYLTLEAVVKLTGALGAESGIIGKRNAGGGYQLSLDTDGSVVFCASTESHSGACSTTETNTETILITSHGTVPADSQWHHVAVILDRDAATLSTYVDGVVQDVPQSGVLLTSTARLSNTSPVRLLQAGITGPVCQTNMTVSSIAVSKAVRDFTAFPDEDYLNPEDVVDQSVWYVSETASGLGDCTSAANACGTLADVEALDLDPGDWVLFERGSTWWNDASLYEDSPGVWLPVEDDFIIPTGGIKGSHIGFGVYGTGADPILSGSQSQAAMAATSADWDWTASGLPGSYYYIDTTPDPAEGNSPPIFDWGTYFAWRVFREDTGASLTSESVCTGGGLAPTFVDVPCLPAAPVCPGGSCTTATVGSMADGQFAYGEYSGENGTDTLYLRWDSGTPPTVLLHQNDVSFDVLASRSYVTLVGLQFTHGGSGPRVVLGDTSTGFHFYHVNSSYNLGFGINAEGGDRTKDGLYADVRVINSVVRDNFNDGVAVKGKFFGLAYASKNWGFQMVGTEIVGNFGDGLQLFYWDGTLSGTANHRDLIENNVAYDNFGHGFNQDGTSATTDFLCTGGTHDGAYCHVDPYLEDLPDTPEIRDCICAVGDIGQKCTKVGTDCSEEDATAADGANGCVCTEFTSFDVFAWPHEDPLSTNVLWSACTTEGGTCASSGDDLSDHKVGVSGVEFAYNTSYDNHSCGILFEFDAHYNYIHHNLVYNNGQPYPREQCPGGIGLTHTTWDNLVSYNTVVGQDANGGGGISVNTEGSHPLNTTRDNYFFHNTLVDNSGFGTHQFYLQRSAGNIAANNVIDTSGQNKPMFVGGYNEDSPVIDYNLFVEGNTGTNNWDYDMLACSTGSAIPACYATSDCSVGTCAAWNQSFSGHQSSFGINTNTNTMGANVGDPKIPVYASEGTYDYTPTAAGDFAEFQNGMVLAATYHDVDVYADGDFLGRPVTEATPTRGAFEYGDFAPEPPVSIPYFPFVDDSDTVALYTSDGPPDAIDNSCNALDFNAGAPCTVDADCDNPADGDEGGTCDAEPGRIHDSHTEGGVSCDDSGSEACDLDCSGAACVADAATWTTGADGTAFVCSGIDHLTYRLDEAALDLGSTASSDITLEAVIKATSGALSSNEFAVVSKQQVSTGYYMGVTDHGGVYCCFLGVGEVCAAQSDDPNLGDSTIATTVARLHSTKTITPDQWTHIACVLDREDDGGTLTVSIAGEAETVALDPDFDVDLSNSDRLYLYMKYAGQGLLCPTGAVIDEVRISDFPRDPADFPSARFFNPIRRIIVSTDQ